MSFDFLGYFSSTKPAAPARVAAVPKDAAAPSLMTRAIEMASQMWDGGKQRAQAAMDMCAPSVKTATEMAGITLHSADKVTSLGIKSLLEWVDFTDQSGTHDPSASIKKSYDRLSQHDQPFADCVAFLADRAAQHYVKHAESISLIIGDLIRAEKQSDKEESYTQKAKSTVLTSLADFSEWFANLSKDLIGQTIKANILHIAANLADKGFDPSHPFPDQQRNPFGRLLSVVGKSFIDHEAHLQKIALLPKHQQPVEYQRAFEALSKDLLATLFPKGAEDIQLFHPRIPLMNVAKEIAWDVIHQQLPVLLQRLYHETRPVAKENPDWKAEFDDESQGIEAEQLVQLPSVLIHHAIRKDKGKWLESQMPELEKLLWKQGIEDKQAQAIVKYAKELLLTDDASLHQAGAFFERYFMEHLLVNLTHYRPDDVTIPCPLYLLEQWIKGDLFKTLTLALAGKTLEPEDKVKAVQDLLAPLGLNQKESFPLPPVLKEALWKNIDAFEQKDLPDLIFKAIPIWMSFNKKAHYQQKIDRQLADPSFTKTSAALLGTIIDKQLLELNDISLAKTLNQLNDNGLPSMMLSEEQQEKIDEQWQALLEKKDVLDLLKDFGKQCAEALTQQLFLDLYKRYQKACQPEEEAHSLGIGMSWLFEGADLEDEMAAPSPIPSFVEWLFLEGTKACESLALEDFSDNQIKAFREAIRLRDGLRDPAKERVQAKKERAALDLLWIKIEPQFKSLTQHLLGTLGYEKASDLPFPEGVQSFIWKNLNEKAPRIIFEQMGDALLPVFEKRNLQAQVEALPHGAFMKRGCHSLSQDIVDHLAEFLTKEEIQKLLEKQSDLKLTDQAETYAVNTLTAIIDQEHPAYAPICTWMASYLEGLLLKVTIRMSEMSQSDLQKIRILAEKTREKVLELEEEDNAEEIHDTLVEFTDAFLALLGIQSPQDLFGIPQAVQKTVLKEMKGEIAKNLLGVYRVEHHIRNYVVRPNPVEEIISTSEVASAVLGLTHYALDIATDELTKRVDGELKIIPKMYDSLDKALEKQAAKGFQTAKLFQEVIKDELPTPFLTHLLDGLDAPSTQAYKKEFADWVNPLLTDQVIQLLAPVLEKEKEGQAEFDQALLMALVPVFTRHLKHLNQAAQSVGGLSYDNFIDVVDDEMHPAVPISTVDKEAVTLHAKKNFYSKQMDLLFPLIFPNGKEDLNKFLLDFKLSDKQFDVVLDAAKDALADQLPEVLDSLFDREMLMGSLSDLFESVIDEVLDQPIDIESDAEKELLSAEEQARQKKMDRQIGELFIEAVRFMDLPVGIFERLPGWGVAKKGAYEAVGAAMRKQFNGEFLAKNLQEQLPKWAAKKHVKKSDEEKAEAKQKAEERYQELERKLAEKSVAFLFNYLGAQMKEATDIFTHPVLRAIRYAILATCSFVIVRLIGSTLRFLKVDRFVVNRVHEFIQHVSHKSLDVFSQKDLHTDVIYHSVEAFEEALIDEMAK